MFPERSPFAFTFHGDVSTVVRQYVMNICAKASFAEGMNMALKACNL
jgi:hypothetical protein